MATPRLSQRRWVRMVQDIPRFDLPNDFAWNLVDFVPGLGDALRKRGGWTYASPSLTAVAASATYAFNLAHVPFTAGDQLVAFSDDGYVIKINSASSATAISAAGGPPLQTAYFNDKLAYAASGGTAAPNVYNGTAASACSGSPPNAKYVASYKSRLWVAGSTSAPLRIYASGILNENSWDTTNTYVDVSFPVRGLAALQNTILVFGDRRTARIRGSVPPPDGDLALDDPIFELGCYDPRSIVVAEGYCYFANGDGVYRTNGTSYPEDLTAAAGLKTYWRTNMMQKPGASYTVRSIACGVWGGRLFVTSVFVSGGSYSYSNTLVIELDSRNAYTFSNFPASAYAIGSSSGVTRMYLASGAAPRLLDSYRVFNPSAAYDEDADGTDIQPILETPFFFDPQTGKKRLRHVYLTYYLADENSQDPTLTVSYLTEPSSTSYTALSPTLSESTTNQMTRARLPLRTKGHGIAFKVAQTTRSSDTRITALGIDGHNREGLRA